MAIKKNQVIKLNYELKINGEIVDNNIGADPIEFVYGAGDLIPGLESKIVDMNEGETKKIKVLAAEAYGEYNEELSEVVPKEAFEGIDLQIGLVLEADTEILQEIRNSFENKRALGEEMRRLQIKLNEMKERNWPDNSL